MVLRPVWRPFDIARIRCRWTEQALLRALRRKTLDALSSQARRQIG
jgi:hypothetical protein